MLRTRLSPTGRRGRATRMKPGAALAAAVIVTVCAFAMPSAGSAATACWQRVIADWSPDGRIDRVYPPACYRQAVKLLPEDLRAYSSAPEDIDRALTERRSLQTHVEKTATAVQPVAAAPAGRNALAVVVPGLAGLLVAVGLAVWLLRGRTRDPGSSSAPGA